MIISHIILIFLFPLFKSDIPLIPLKEDNKNQLLIEVCLTKENKIFNMYLDIDTLYTWVPSSESTINFKKVINDKSSDVKIINSNVSLQYENDKKINGNYISTSCTISKYNLNNFNLISVISTYGIYDKNIEGYFSLGYPYSNEAKSYSILYNLKQNNQIDKKVFSIYFDQSNNGFLLLGKTTNEITDKKNYGLCKIDTNFNNNFGHWYCKIKGLLLGKNIVNDQIINFTDENNNKIKFDFKQIKTFFPIIYILKLEQIYFNKLINEGNCNFGIKNNIFTFTCLENKYNELSDLTLVINDDFGLYISKEDLFIYDEEDKEYEFIFYAKDGINEFILGSHIMKKYSMIFNIDDNQVGMYNSKGKIIKLNDKEEEEKRKEEEERKKQEEKRKEEEERKKQEEKRKEEEERKKQEEKRKDEEERKKQEEKRKEEERKKQEEKKQDNPVNPKKEENINQKESDNNKGGFGIIIIILIILILIIFIYRYYKKKKYLSSNYFYKEIFNAGTQLEDKF